MNHETTLNIILVSLNAALHVISLLISIIKRHKSFTKCLHLTWVGALLYCLSLVGGVGLPILILCGVIRSDGSITNQLVFVTCLCLITLFVSTTCFCYSVFIDGTVVYKKTLFSCKCIDISKPEVFINYPHPYNDGGPLPSNIFNIEIIYFDKWIEINSSSVEGDLDNFVSLCKAIQNKRLEKKK